MNDFWNNRLILKAYAGSVSYGTNTPESDVDTRGICIPPADILLGLNSFEQYLDPEVDETIYSLKKFVSLALNNNPNIIDTLFVDDKHIIHLNEFGRELREIRNAFLSTRVYKTYGGYAAAQLKKMCRVEKNAIGKRAATIEKYGYDTKNAMHLIRLIKMAIEILSGEGVNVYRHDRHLLNDIRNGHYTLEQINEMYQALVRDLDKAFVYSPLPDKPNTKMIEAWLVDVQKRSLEWVA